MLEGKEHWIAILWGALGGIKLIVAGVEVEVEGTWMACFVYLCCKVVFYIISYVKIYG